MANGGARPGAGRKKGQVAKHTLDAAAAKARMVQLVCENIDAIFKPLIAKAMEGDVAAAREVLDRSVGRAVQAVVTLDEDGKNVAISSINVIPISTERSKS